MSELSDSEKLRELAKQLETGIAAIYSADGIAPADLRRIADRLEALENAEIQWKNTVIKLQYTIRDLREAMANMETWECGCGQINEAAQPNCAICNRTPYESAQEIEALKHQAVEGE